MRPDAIFFAFETIQLTYRLVSSVTSANLTARLSERVMGWTVAPDRFLMAKRGWMPRWRFQPTENLVDAFRLLEASAFDEFSMSGNSRGDFRVCVRIGDCTGEAAGTSKSLAITYAIARAVGIEVDS